MESPAKCPTVWLVCQGGGGYCIEPNCMVGQSGRGVIEWSLTVNRQSENITFPILRMRV